MPPAPQMLYNKWWKKSQPGGPTTKLCPKADVDPTKASALNVVNIGGVFVVRQVQVEVEVEVEVQR